MTEPEANASSVCSHCQLPLGRGPIHDGELSFCCAGCQMVHGTIHSLGLEAYYRARDGQGARANVPSADFEVFDDPRFLELHSKPADDGKGRSVVLHLAGLHCSACVWLIEKLPSVLEGVTRARLSFTEARLEVSFDPSKVRLSEICKKLSQLGYEPHASSGETKRRHERAAERRLLARMGVAGAAFGNVMLLGLALYSGEAADMVPRETTFLRWLSLIVTVPALLYSGQPFFRGALLALRSGTVQIDLPISIGVLAATLSSVVNTIRGAGEVYFDSVIMLVFVLLTGRLLQSIQLGRAREATDLMSSLAPSTCRIVGTDGIQVLPTEAVERGAMVEVPSGARIGVDGVVVSGTSTVDRSLLSGESAPLRVGVNDPVFAGTINLSSRLLLRAVSTGKETRLAAMVADVERATRAKAHFVELADRISTYFLWAALALAGVAVALARFQGSDGIERAVAVLLVTCPCALGLSTPLAASVSLGQAARQGILIKGARFLELLSRPGLFVFDKTGTLTSGRVSVVDWDGDPEVLGWVASAESGSAHPIASAFRTWVGERPGVVAREATEVLGSGVSALVDGRRVRVGKRSYAIDDTAEGCAPEFQARADALEARGLSPIFVAVDGKVVSVAGVGDALRPEAKKCLSELVSLGHRLAIASGDSERVVSAVARELGVPFAATLGQLTPADKLAYIETARQKSKVFMVGDGVNDAAALSLADVGIAVHGGAEASLAAADIFSTRGGLRPVVELALGARRTMALVHRNLGLSLVYNVLAASLAVTGHITPLWAAVLMPLSSLTVVISTVVHRSFGAQRGNSARQDLGIWEKTI
jgi:P-type Cu2+ transporter